MADIGVSWSRAVFICLAILSLYNGGCHAEVGLTCSGGNTTNCTTPEICSNELCACDTATHYQNGSVCETSKFLLKFLFKK
ncbi:hypothetical protein KP79_PYT07502 [Mizuhopecten yessoensis]|uniref:EB domain-containing protein n=1 Tax=Mizuhopecten yessoensis TaxID=6573 RepID=A0A210Q1V3_MIZYE|nr:hypothetical protein KP79_PYT07502 [Mizuhopecten yessoensis]